jgi:hypothetical protein
MLMIDQMKFTTTCSKVSTKHPLRHPFFLPPICTLDTYKLVSRLTWNPWQPSRIIQNRLSELLIFLTYNYVLHFEVNQTEAPSKAFGDATDM